MSNLMQRVAARKHKPHHECTPHPGASRVAPSVNTGDAALALYDRRELFGQRVKLNEGCCGNIAVIGRCTGPHFGELRCAACGAHRGWLSKSAADWITTVINKFGAPDAPIVIRRSHVRAG